MRTSTIKTGLAALTLGLALLAPVYNADAAGKKAKKAKITQKASHNPVRQYTLTNSISQTGINFIKRQEGVSYTLYDDCGKPAIGYGHDLLPGEKYTKIDENTADMLLRRDLSKAEKAVKASVNVPLNQNQYDALVSFTFNVGPAALKRSSLLKKVNAREYDNAAERFAVWNTANGNKYSAVLDRRRQEERNLFANKTTIYSSR